MEVLEVEKMGISKAGDKGLRPKLFHLVFWFGFNRDLFIVQFLPVQ
jgi:hypothetical protein